MSKKSFSQRVLTFLNLGEEGKLGRFEKNLVKYLDKQISLLKEELATIDEKIEDSTEAFNDKVLTVEVEKIASVESMERYIPEYVSGLNNSLVATLQLEEKKEEVQAKIDRFNTLKTKIETVEEVK